MNGKELIGKRIYYFGGGGKRNCDHRIEAEVIDVAEIGESMHEKIHRHFPGKKINPAIVDKGRRETRVLIKRTDEKGRFYPGTPQVSAIHLMKDVK